VTPALDGDQRRERIIAGLLHYGTWIASAFIGAGMIVGSIGGLHLPAVNGYFIVKIGVALFILLPVARVQLPRGLGGGLTGACGLLAILIQESDESQ
jgi:hypothetical protein